MQSKIFYKERIKNLESNLAALLKRKTQLGWARFISMAGILTGIYFLLAAPHIYFLIATIILLVIFIRFVYADTDNKSTIQHTKHLIQLNKDELLALSGTYAHFEDGAAYIPQDHLYANDIDILGRASLFQYINRTTSEMGGGTLANWLLQPATEEVILQRQLSIKELSGKIEWQQELQATGKEKKIKTQTQQKLQIWLTEESAFENKYWLWLKYAVPAIIITVIILNIFSFTSNPVRNYFLLASAILAFYIAKRVMTVYFQVSKMADELDVMADSIDLIEKAEFKTILLQQFQSAFLQSKTSASKELKELKHILARFDYRLNPVVFIPLVIILQWDLQQVIALEQWKKRNQQNIHQWFEALGKLEAISSLSILHFNHPNWCFPKIVKEHFSIEGKEIGHPLINENKRVNNYINIQHKKELMLITGSNMAGKSTYLRSIGINVVLAMAGSVVCAESFSLSPVQLMTSMRISDNLEENTSTFYAELKKLKTVIDKVNNKEKVFILLDEILRGTNSLDRHTGSKALIQQLIRHNACGIIATHDIELAKLKEDYPDNILNYYFDVQVSKDELYFDYRLKEGICNSLNASILMKKIGIEL